ncbi:hypothetical protein V8E53_013977 [Lactarius tabidus]
MEPNTPYGDDSDSRSGVRAAHGKHTFASQDTPAPTATQATRSIQVTQGNAAKRAQAIGPARARPMALQLPGEDEIIGNGDGVVTQELPSGKRLERTSSYYPNHGDYTHPLAALDPETLAAHNLDPNDDGIENEDDWIEVGHAVDITRKMSARTAVSMAMERPSWQGAYTTNVLGVNLTGTTSGHGSVASTPCNSALQLEPKAPTAEPSVIATALQNEVLERSVTSGISEAKWAPETDLILPAGGTKPLLTNQTSLVRSIVHDAIENMRAMLMFNHAFPDSALSSTFAKDSLLTAAEKQAEKGKPGAAAVHSRLQHDVYHLAMIINLPRARIPLLQSEVKERCHDLSVPEILAIGSASKITEVIRLQLSDYTYTYPTAARSGLLSGLVQRTRPYRNARIILVIQELFFTGGDMSFASRFDHLFPVYQDNKCMLTREVPAPMVALVATALYATLHEWKSGKQHAIDFSANTYLDVYRAHIDTFKVIKEKRPNAYHVMMADIYTQASTTPEDTPGIPIANIDLDTLED